jgi:hypothetical protein
MLDHILPFFFSQFCAYEKLSNMLSFLSLACVSAMGLLGLCVALPALTSSTFEYERSLIIPAEDSPMNFASMQVQVQAGKKRASTAATTTAVSHGTEQCDFMFLFYAIFLFAYFGCQIWRI